MRNRKKAESNCEICMNYYYDDEYGDYICGANFDEDEMYALMTNPEFSCPYYFLNDEYKIVRKQI